MRDHELLDFLKWHIPHMNQLSMLTWMSICTKMKTNRVHTSLSPQSNCRRSSLLPFTCVAWIIWNENHAPATEDHWTHNELYKTKEEQQIFLVFSNWKQEQKETSKQSKIFLDFLIANQRWQIKQNRNKKPK